MKPYSPKEVIDIMNKELPVRVIGYINKVLTQVLDRSTGVAKISVNDINSMCKYKVEKNLNAIRIAYQQQGWEEVYIENDTDMISSLSKLVFKCRVKTGVNPVIDVTDAFSRMFDKKVVL